LQTLRLWSLELWTHSSRTPTSTTTPKLRWHSVGTARTDEKHDIRGEAIAALLVVGVAMMVMLAPFVAMASLVVALAK